MDKTMTTIDKCHPSSYEKLSSILSYIGRFLQELQRNAEAETVYKMALKHQSSSTEYSAEEHSQLKYIECVLAIGVACARQNEPIKLKEACDWLKQALETVQLLLMVCIGEAMASTLQYYQGQLILVDHLKNQLILVDHPSVDFGQPSVEELSIPRMNLVFFVSTQNQVPQIIIGTSY